MADSIILGCGGCITVHTYNARKLSASTDEIAEALGTAVSVNAAAGTVYSTRVMDAYRASTEADEAAKGRASWATQHP